MGRYASQITLASTKTMYCEYWVWTSSPTRWNPKWNIILLTVNMRIFAFVKHDKRCNSFTFFSKLQVLIQRISFTASFPTCLFLQSCFFFTSHGIFHPPTSHPPRPAPAGCMGCIGPRLLPSICLKVWKGWGVHPWEKASIPTRNITYPSKKRRPWSQAWISRHRLKKLLGCFQK